MSAAANAKTAKGRAGIAVRMVMSGQKLGRSFDDCFEMNDGEQVIQDILRRCKVDARIAQEFICRRVFGPEVTEKLQQIVKESYEPQRIGGNNK